MQKRKYIIDEKTAKARKLALEEAKNSNSITAEEEEEIKRKAIEEYIKKKKENQNQKNLSNKSSTNKCQPYEKRLLDLNHPLYAGIITSIKVSISPP